MKSNPRTLLIKTTNSQMSKPSTSEKHTRTNPKLIKQLVIVEPDLFRKQSSKDSSQLNSYMSPNSSGSMSTTNGFSKTLTKWGPIHSLNPDREKVSKTKEFFCSKNSLSLKPITPFSNKYRLLHNSCSSILSSDPKASVQINQFIFDKLVSAPSEEYLNMDRKIQTSGAKLRSVRKNDLHEDLITDYRPNNRHHSELYPETTKKSEVTDMSTRISTPMTSFEERSIFKTRIKLPDQTQDSKADLSPSKGETSSSIATKSGAKYLHTFSNKEEIKIFNNPKVFRIKKDFAANYKLTLHKKSLTDQRQNQISNDIIIKQNKNKLLAVIDEEIDNNIRYCFVCREVEKDIKSIKNNVNIEFKIKLDEIRQKMRLSAAYCHVYLINGKSIYELNQIPKNQNIIIISTKTILENSSRFLNDDFIREFYEYEQKSEISVYTENDIKESIYLEKENAILNIEEKAKNLLNALKSDSELDIPSLEKEINLQEPIDSNIIKKYIDNVGQQQQHPRLSRLYTKHHDKHYIDNKFDEFSIIKEINKNNNIFEDNGEIKHDKPIDKDISNEINNINKHKDFNNSNIFEGNNSGGDDDAGIESKELDNETKKYDYESKLNEYINNDIMLTKNDKLDLYQKIENSYYELKQPKIIPEECEEAPTDPMLVNNDLDESDDSNKEKKLDEVSSNLQILLSRIDKQKKKIDYIDYKNYIDKIIRRRGLQVSKEVNIIKKLPKELTMQEQNQLKTNYIHQNKKIGVTKKSHIHKLYRLNKDLFPKNIPQLLKEKNLSRQELHCVYILYKALCEVTSQRYENYKPEDGIDFLSFRHGIYQVFLQSEEIASSIFNIIDSNYSGFLNWEEFLNAMVILRAKTLKDKIDLFIKIADADENGLLSKEEIYNLCKTCLGKFLKQDNENFLDELCKYFTKLIFYAVNVPISEDIPLGLIKDAILSGNAESDLLSMFCGADI